MPTPGDGKRVDAGAAGGAAPWDALDAELDRWAAAARPATLWWRDDDAVQASPALARLAALSAAHGVPLALAVVPAALAPTLPAALAGAGATTVLQHGYAHRNHAPAGAKACELGGARPVEAIVRELAAGRAVLREAFGAAFLPVVVPPWNRLDEAVVRALPDLGYRGLSTFAPRAAAAPVAGLTQCNAHVDPIAWRAGRGFAGAPACLAALVGHLAARRTGAADPDEATGLLTHHLVTGEDAWDFVGALLARTRCHAGARWIGAAEAFSAGRPA